MSRPRLRIEETALLIIDVQERLLPSLIEPDRLVSRCAYLGRVAEVLGIPTVVTEHYVRGLGRSAAAVLESSSSATFVEKTRFSACVPTALSRIAELNRRSVLICGAETHVCVMQSVLDLLDCGYQTFVVADAVSCGEIGEGERALARMMQAGSVITGCVSATYELLADAGHPGFRSCLPLVKGLREDS